MKSIFALVLTLTFSQLVFAGGGGVSEPPRLSCMSAGTGYAFVIYNYFEEDVAVGRVIAIFTPERNSRSGTVEVFKDGRMLVQSVTEPGAPGIALAYQFGTSLEDPIALRIVDAKGVHDTQDVVCSITEF